MRQITGEPAATVARRLMWLDAARGIGIVLVVYAHGARALVDVLPFLGAFKAIDTLVYAFHMQLFFFLAGLVSVKSLNQSRKSYLGRKFGTVIYPYVLWSAIYWLLETLFASRVNSPLDYDAILWIWLHPIEHLWFLYVLFFCQLLAAFTWPRVALLTLLSGWMLLGPLPPINVPAFWTQFPWFITGLVLAPRFLAGAPTREIEAGGGLVLGVFLAAIAAAVFGQLDLAALAKFAMAGVGISLTVAAAYLVRRVRPVTYLGEASLSIYLMHTIFSAGVRELLEIVFPVGGLVLLAITVVAGVLLPLIVHEAARRSGVAPYFGLGRMAPGPREQRRIECDPKELTHTV
uniref:acyltransferase family protein n=1 Tax=Altererythrobacter segetis TaxID=1104773 RepID=UPI001409F799|nr:acyltransferase family protein [Altererythrobacter segetis]